MDTNNQQEKDKRIIESLLKALNYSLFAIMILLFAVILLPIIALNEDAISTFFKSKPERAMVYETVEPKDTIKYWHPLSLSEIKDSNLQELAEYGQDLIAHTAKYLGPNGSVLKMSNGMNCQNCHLEAGTKTFGNNYGSVASTYPKFRERSGSIENIYKRVNDCFERSLNGKALDTTSKEMQAIVAYIKHIGANVEKGKRAVGSGFKDLAFLDRAADPIKGKLVYEAKCLSCHQANGDGQMNPDGVEYAYPPLWGKNSYNDGAGLYRISNFAKFVKYNMPLGVNHLSAQLTDEEAWDVAAYVNSQPRPHKNVPKDWPDKSKKPIDHPFGPFADKFTEQQHKYGPFAPIKAFKEELSKQKKTQ